MKEAPREDISKAIETLHRGESILHPAVAARLITHVAGGADPAIEDAASTASNAGGSSTRTSRS